MAKKKRKPRNYNRNPLAYFREHEEKYAGMSRAKLSIYDKGLYRALLRAGQLEQAIPNVRVEGSVERGRLFGQGKLEILSEEQHKEIISAYETYDGNASEASRHLPYSYNIIWNRWLEKGLRTKKRSRHLNKREIRKVLDAYEKYEGIAYRAAKHLHYNIQKILRHWRKNGFKIKEPRSKSLSQRQIDEIEIFHETYDGNASEASRHLPYSSSTIIKYWRNAKLDIKSVGRPFK